MIYLPLTPSGKIPIVGLGTLAALDEEMEKGLNAALEAGYRHIDTATVYKNEKVIGRVLKQWLDAGKVKREELFITTKLPVYAMSPSGVDKYLQRSLENLQLDYLDLYLIHAPIGLAEADTDDMMSLEKDKDGNVVLDMKTDHLAIWRALEAKVDEGKIKAIGVSNFNSKQIQRIIDNCKIKPANLQVENQLYFQQKPLWEYCKDNNITMTAYFTLGSPGYFALKVKADGKAAEIKSPMENDDVVRIAKKHGKSPAQILLKHSVQKGIIVIPKSSNPGRLRDNISLFDWNLSETDMAVLNAQDLGDEGRMGRLSGILKGVEKHPEYPYNK